MDLRRELEKIVVDDLLDDSLFVVELSVSKTKGPKKIKLLIDGDNGLSIDRCSQISRKLGGILEEKDIIEQAYILEVSSPGIDYPLVYQRQYKKNVGRKIRVLLNNDLELTGELQKVEKDFIVINKEERSKNKKITNTSTEINFSEIKKTNVLISFK